MSALLAGRARVICMMGPGGMGKSRLAAEMLGGRGDVAWCSLDQARSAEDLRESVAASLGVDGARADVQAILASTAAQILVLDNVEQVVAAVAEHLPLWLAAAPRLQVLVTSRARLQVAGEHVHRLEPLGTGHGGDAARLFIERGRAQVPAFDPDAEAGAAIEQLVTQLDGIPLAIELAAARLAWLSPTALLARLDRRFDMLAGQRLDVGDRQRTLRGAIAWSWQLLSAADRAALVRCSTCRGWFGLDLGEALLADDPDALARLGALVDQSMLRVANVDGVRRFGFFESIKAFVRAESPPGALATAEQMHAEWVVEQGEQLHAQIDGPNGQAAHRALLALRDELWAVVARSTDPARLLLALTCLHPVVVSHGPLAPQVAALDALLHRLPPTDLPSALLLRGQALRLQGRLAEARADLEQAASAPGPHQAEALSAAGIAAHEAGDLDVADARYATAMDAFAAADDARGLGRASGSLAILAEARGQSADAQTRYEQALDLLRQAQDTRSEVIFLINLADLHLQQDRVAEAEMRHARASVLLESLDDRRLRAVLAGNQGAADQHAGRLDAAIARRTEAVDGLRTVGDQRLAAVFIGYRGTAHHEAGDTVTALADYDAAVAGLRTAGDTRFATLFTAHRTALTGDVARLEHLAAPAGSQLEAVIALHRGEQPAVPVRGIDVAFVRRLRGEADPAAAPALIISPGADWLQAPGEDGQSIRRRHTLRRLLAAFAEARETQPGQGMQMNALIAAGWPGEQILPHAAANRVYVAIATLRKLGLRDLLHSHEDGYLLDPATPLVRAERPT
ncbi:MAG: putative ATPase/Tfp pilus assembly protein PilF [Bradymonadia bacterium]